MGDKKVRMQFGNKFFSSILAMMVVITTIFANDITGIAAAKSTITLSSKQETIAAGRSVQLKVKAIKGLKSKSVTWKSSNTKVAKVSSKGKVTGLKAGSSKITAVSKVNKKVKATCKITVKKDAVETIELDKAACVVVKGKTAKINIKDIVPATASSNVTWKIKKSAIAKVSVKGKTAIVTGKKAGKTTLIATAADGSKKTAEVEILVVNKKSSVKKVTGVQVSIANEEILVGSTTKAKAIIKPSNASLKTVYWSSSDEKIAKVDSSGKIVAIKAGQVNITATAQDGSGKKSTVTLVVKDNVEPMVTDIPTATPTTEPLITTLPTNAPTVTLTVIPTVTPTTVPTVTPTKVPAVTPTNVPTVTPTNIPTVTPTKVPTATPTAEPQVTEPPADVWYENIEDAGKALREEMKRRNSTIKLKYKVSGAVDETFVQTLTNNIVTEAFKHTGVPTEGDYIEKQMGGYQAGMSYYSDGSAYYLTITYNIPYYTNAQQEAEVDSKITEVIKGLNLDGASDYQKVKEIYDYICKNVTYDYTNLDNESYKLKYTAYAALINNTSVCQGYANLLYRMLLEAGVDSRIVTGTSDNQGHAWNIVKLDGMYYYLDSTWDATRVQNGFEYGYFLRGTTGFDDHTLDSKFETAEYTQEYPISESMYQMADSSE
ncbi:MAG: Ig-like domain-containing protein [Lachnospiraceae bacterium]|nr:Ig-like domain-containing protein [Lachnospiraceae bacterium]